MNRSTRRAATKRWRTLMNNNGNGAQVSDVPVAIVREPLAKPEVVADLTVVEASEIKERKRLIDAQVNTVGDAQRVLTLLKNENQTFLQQLVARKGLPADDGYNVDAESGVVVRTARAVPQNIKSETIEVAAAAAPEGD